MKSILLIGIGRFGKHIAMDLHRLNHQVMVVDDNEERINELLPYVTNAQIGDSTNRDFLESLGVTVAYNLDGGGSATMYFNGRVVNQPTYKGKEIEERKVSDIVYIGY